jgi:hypothetical protein
MALWLMMWGALGFLQTFRTRVFVGLYWVFLVGEIVGRVWSRCQAYQLQHLTMGEYEPFMDYSEDSLTKEDIFEHVDCTQNHVTRGDRDSHFHFPWGLQSRLHRRVFL